MRVPFFAHAHSAVQLHGYNLGSLSITVIRLHPVVRFSFFFVDILGFLFFVCIKCWDHMARGRTRGGRRRRSGAEQTRPYADLVVSLPVGVLDPFHLLPPTTTTPSAQDSQLQIVPTSEALQIQLPANPSLEDFITLIRTVVREERSATANRDPHSSRDLAVSTAPNTVLPFTAAPVVSLLSSMAASTSTPADTTTRVSQSQPLPVPLLTSSSLLPLPVPLPLLQSVATGHSGAGMLCVEGE